ncbi:MAG: C40 family peptidase [Chitinophagaceae bacterium]
MVKQLITASTIVLLLASNSPIAAQNKKSNGPSASKTSVRFLDDIEVGIEEAPASQDTKTSTPKIVKQETSYINKKEVAVVDGFSVEKASALQLKYSILLDTEVEQVQNASLFEAIDEWYGTRYRYGGTTKNGIDCSAFVQVMFSTVLGIALPRTAREQYGATRRIQEDEELMEGDLVFFNTTGGVSHVGVYLQNNKFVHAATSGGVMISDLDEAYWSKRFIGAGRYQKPSEALTFISKP